MQVKMEESTEPVKIKLPYSELIVGITGCGKTYYLLKRLEKILEGNPTLQHIFIICPTIKYNRTFKEWKLVKKYINKIKFIGCHQNGVDKEIEKIIKNDSLAGTDQNLKTLVVLDDCAMGKDVKNRASELVSLSYAGRHQGIGIITITQYLTAVARAYRSGVTRLITFYTESKKDVVVLMDEFLSRANKNEREEIQNKLYNSRYGYLVVEKVYPRCRYLVLPK